MGVRLTNRKECIINHRPLALLTVTRGLPFDADHRKTEGAVYFDPGNRVTARR
jgi:hypothetical protein